MPLPRVSCYLGYQFDIEIAVIFVQWYVGYRFGFHELVGMLCACRTGMGASALHDVCAGVRVLEASQ